MPMQLRRNPQLTTWFVRNLNLEPSGWAMADNSVDAVTCCVRWDPLAPVQAVPAASVSLQAVYIRAGLFLTASDRFLPTLPALLFRHEHSRMHFAQTC